MCKENLLVNKTSNLNTPETITDDVFLKKLWFKDVYERSWYKIDQQSN